MTHFCTISEMIILVDTKPTCQTSKAFLTSGQKFSILGKWCWWVSKTCSVGWNLYTTKKKLVRQRRIEWSTSRNQKSWNFITFRHSIFYFPRNEMFKKIVTDIDCWCLGMDQKWHFTRNFSFPVVRNTFKKTNLKPLVVL